MLSLDHLAVCCGTLTAGVAYVEDALGVRMAGGGQHALMATHNRLLGLGDLYLEVIAADPGQVRPDWPRWFDLDNFEGTSRLSNWVAACDDLGAALQQCPAGTGVPMAFARAEYRWQMAVPGDGRLPFDGGFPAVIQWEGPAHPAQALPECGVRLQRLEIAHPDAVGLTKALKGLIRDPRIAIVVGGTKAMRATFETGHGTRVLE